MASTRPAGVRMRRVARQSAGSPSRSGHATSKPRSPSWLRGVGRIVAPLSARAPRGSRIDSVSHDGPILVRARERVTTSRPSPQDTFRPDALRRKSFPPRPVSWLLPPPPSMSLSPSIAAEPIVALSAGHPLEAASDIVLSRPPDRTTLRQVDHHASGALRIREPVESRPAVQRVGVRRQARGAAVHVAIGERVTAAPPDQPVGPAAAVEHIVGRAARQHVVAGAAEGIDAADDVRARPRRDRPVVPVPEQRPDGLQERSGHRKRRVRRRAHR